MSTTKELCHILQQVDPKLGECGKNYDVYQDRKNKAWVVDYHNNKHHLKTFIDQQEAKD